MDTTFLNWQRSFVFKYDVIKMKKGSNESTNSNYVNFLKIQLEMNNGEKLGKEFVKNAIV